MSSTEEWQGWQSLHPTRWARNGWSGDRLYNNEVVSIPNSGLRTKRTISQTKERKRYCLHPTQWAQNQNTKSEIAPLRSPMSPSHPVGLEPTDCKVKNSSQTGYHPTRWAQNQMFSLCVISCFRSLHPTQWARNIGKGLHSKKWKMDTFNAVSIPPSGLRT